ncbi:MAG: PLP-dependent aminotransferase family protein [Armatimonadota bacterium]|nr:PLP-dependent aminotransferase family protein [Armatimonadota bacterium]MDR7423180.1 PLP-dependent aminotransferase family protein [Armatimonadota bacterium]MDR7455410.1 PLP-dependent aminotransferase family protein [Armatimonadota bacterium]MDR7456450.1 PLP-dependent aminotransferase family protein [Armatimonadota bacterium]MDR7496872.1 PLP-dependent aminotransferase family protein [Armatimonadota bacterium]
MIEFEAFFSRSARTAERSTIRELLKLAGRGNVVSFAGGLPDPETFPVDELRAVADEVLRTDAARALQYGTTEGDPRLRAQLAAWMAKDGLQVAPDDILITTGSQQALDLVGRVLLEPGDAIVCELPSYLGGLQAFRAYQVEMVGVRQDDEGMAPADLAEALRRLARAGRRPKFIYVVPDFQNPSGITWTQERREQLLALAGEFGTLIVEDNPYREMRFAGMAPPPIAALDRAGRTLYLSTFSKTLAPGLRIGWLAGPAAVIERCVTAKQAMDLCGPALTQAIAAALLARGGLLTRLPEVVARYRRKCTAMLEALEREMPPGVTWTRPEGGLFLWVRLPEGLDAGAMLQPALAEGVAYVPGQAFHCDGGGRNTMRLNFSYPTEAQIAEGIARLARLVRRESAPAIHTIHRRGTTVSD